MKMSKLKTPVTLETAFGSYVITWILVVPAVQNGWTFAFALVVFAAWLLTRRRDP